MRGADRGVVGDVRGDGQQASLVCLAPVEHRHARAAAGEQPGGRQPDAGRAAGNECREAMEFIGRHTSDV
jgi:hypothetical protein